MHTSFSTMNLLRYSVAYVFIISGLMKLLNTDLANYFLSLGLPYPQLMLKLVILLEIGCGALILAGKAVKNAVIPLIAIMIAAILLTKLPTINTGLLQFAFNARLDIVMLVLLIALYKRNP
ncbi:MULTISPECIES: DoxX family protein [Neobacillus]|uniref:DoxX family protein n=1 Tax=Neobacillus citreus TaxID=2833578 RepID=A0A942T814_9BACI|nr:DoxX family protein [Neobacillus citreus]MCH6267060.1 DoxX family protein [Neobacillus citreus]